MVTMDSCEVGYIYCLVDPRYGISRYVGSSIVPRNRYKAHIHRAKSGEHGHKNDWIRLLARLGLKPQLKVVTACSLEQLINKEQEWIDYQRALGFDLTNSECPAECPNRGKIHGKEVRDRFRIAQKERWSKLSEEEMIEWSKIKTESGFKRKKRFSQYYGVHKGHKYQKVYATYFWFESKRYYIGSWDDEIFVARVWDSLVKYYQQHLKFLNFPNEDIEPHSIEYWQKHRERELNKNSKYSGIALTRDGWRVTLSLNNQLKRAGCYKDEIEAARVSDAIQKYYRKDKAKLNFPEESIEPVSAEVALERSKLNKNYSLTGKKYRNISYSKKDKVYFFRFNHLKKDHYKGGFKSEDEAALAYNNYVLEHDIPKPLLTIST